MFETSNQKSKDRVVTGTWIISNRLKLWVIKVYGSRLCDIIEMLGKF